MALQTIWAFEESDLSKMLEGAALAKLPIQDYLISLVDNDLKIAKELQMNTVTLTGSQLIEYATKLIEVALQSRTESDTLRSKLGTSFTSKALYIAYQDYHNLTPWNLLSAHSKIELGKAFKSTVVNSDKFSDKIRMLEHRLSNAQLYAFV